MAALFAYSMTHDPRDDGWSRRYMGYLMHLSGCPKLVVPHLHPAWYEAQSWSDIMSTRVTPPRMVERWAF